MKKGISVCLVAGLALFTQSLWGQEQVNTDAANENRKKEQSAAEMDKAEAEAEATNPLAYLGFGIGIGVINLDEPDIKQTRLVNQIVRVTESEETKTGFWLEVHASLGMDKKTKAGLARRFTHGPFFAVQVAGDGDVINSAALGYMISIKKTRFGDPQDKASFNLGLGYGVTHVDHLGDGLTEGQPLPSGVEEIYLRRVDEPGVVLLVSFSVF